MRTCDAPLDPRVLRPSPFGIATGGLKDIHGNPIPRARCCEVCRQPAERGERWCRHHKGGIRERRRAGGKPTRRPYAKYALWEGSMLHRITSVPVLAQWPPIGRILATRALQRPVPLRDVVETLIRRALGDPTAWPALERRMTEAGIMLPGDPPLPAIAPEDWADDAP